MSTDTWLRRVVKPLSFLLCLAPAVWLLTDVAGERLGANPVEAITHSTGDWALRLLLLTLAVTPLRRLSGWSWPLRLRRMLGLFAFFYAVLHLLVWGLLDHRLDWSAMLEDVLMRPYVSAGMAAFVLLLPLAATSTRGMMRRMGRNWQILHRAVYPIGALAVLHFLWLTKADYLEPVIYASVLVLLLAVRLPLRRWRVRSGEQGGKSPARRSQDTACGASRCH